MQVIECVKYRHHRPVFDMRRVLVLSVDDVASETQFRHGTMFLGKSVCVSPSPRTVMWCNEQGYMALRFEPRKDVVPALLSGHGSRNVNLNDCDAYIALLVLLGSKLRMASRSLSALFVKAESVGYDVQAIAKPIYSMYVVDSRDGPRFTSEGCRGLKVVQSPCRIDALHTGRRSTGGAAYLVGPMATRLGYWDR